MRVAIIHMKYGFKGGLETRLHNYVNYFLARGDEVTVICTKIEPGVVVPDGVHIELVDVKIIPKPIRLLFFNFGTRKVLEDKKFDFCFSMGRTYVQRHVIAPNTHRGYLKAKKQWLTDPSDWLQLWLDKRTFAEAKWIYACSKMTRQEVIGLYGTSPEKVLVAYPPLDTEKFNQAGKMDQAKWKHQFGLDADKQTFAFVSTSHQRKGIEILLNVFDDLIDEPIQLAIAGSDDYYGRTNVKALGFVKNMEELYWAADVTLHPAIYEPYGQIASESLACGTPIFVSEDTGAKEVVSKGTGLVLPTHSFSQWKEAIKSSQPSAYDIPTDFAARNGLSLAQHMNVLLSKM